MRILPGAALVCAFACMPSIGRAAQPNQCTISTSPLAFGTYDDYASADTTAVAYIAYSCRRSTPVSILLDRGGAPSIATRRMTNGAEELLYNLYLDAAGTAMWGDGTGGSRMYSNTSASISKVIVPVYGRIPAQQDAMPGHYSNSVAVTVNF